MVAEAAANAEKERKEAEATAAAENVAADHKSVLAGVEADLAEAKDKLNDLKEFAENKERIEARRGGGELAMECIVESIPVVRRNGKTWMPRMIVKGEKKFIAVGKWERTRLHVQVTRIAAVLVDAGALAKAKPPL